MRLICTNCRRPYPEQGVPYVCPTCHGLFDLPDQAAYDPGSSDSSLPGIWRFHQAFGLPQEATPITLGEGQTPFIQSEAFSSPVYFKLESLNPTGSFKDRGAAVLISFLRSRGVERAAEDSSGNAGASFAAYAARAGIQAQVFIPDSASGPKRTQIEAYGAKVVRVTGPRSNAAAAVRQAVEQDPDLAYASHAYLPYHLTGYGTIAYEIVEQLGQAPGTFIAPAGQGGLLLGAARAFWAMQRSGAISKIPYLVGVQARACAPLWALYSYGSAGLHWVEEGPTLAEGVRVSHPLRGDSLLQLLSAHQGTLLAVDEDEILPGRDELARRGFYVEPTSALVWGALAQLAGRSPEPVVAVLTGSGYKNNH